MEKTQARRVKRCLRKYNREELLAKLQEMNNGACNVSDMESMAIQYVQLKRRKKKKTKTKTKKTPRDDDDEKTVAETVGDIDQVQDEEERRWCAGLIDWFNFDTLARIIDLRGYYINY